MIRNILNVAMMVLLLLNMNYRFMGNAFHEIGGVVLAFLFIFHNVLNWRWYVVFFKGRQSIRRSIVVIAYGVYASFTNNIGEKLLMQSFFVGWGEEPSLWGFLLDHLAIVGCYVSITYYLLCLLRKRNM
ncbi:hypothetical protein [Sporomusa aerivorans]|uniref:hypothetical protein n=1 Tax=Sporomusa aerivorans TaxID=204936 RepID=UPI00352B0268